MNFILLIAIIFAVSLVDGAVGSPSYSNHPISNSEDLDHPIGDSEDLDHPIGHSEDFHKTINPCQEKSSKASYDTFVKRHILTVQFDLNSEDEWKRYLQRSGLCGRTSVQSFINAKESTVQSICRGAGWRVKGASGKKGNLCISRSKMNVYDVKSNNNNGCTMEKPKHVIRQVIVACNKISNKCYPVHYEKSNKQQKGKTVCK